MPSPRTDDWPVMSLVVDKLVEVLATAPNPVLSSGSMAPRRPASPGDLPAVGISLTVDHTRGVGLGRLVREGHTPARHTGVVRVAAGLDTFDASLTRLRLSPLPIRKSPASIQPDFTKEDVQVSNVTNPTQRQVYRLVDLPASPDEYTVDGEAGMILFGAPQIADDRLEVTHWTLTWRDDIRAERYTGTLSLELWVDGPQEADTLRRKVETRLSESPGLLRDKGFISLQPLGLDAAVTVEIGPLGGSLFDAWRQRMTYRFVFEAEEGGELSSGLPIKRIDVNVPRPREVFFVP